MRKRRSLDLLGPILAALLFLASSRPVTGDEVLLRLSGGDRISGVILSETAQFLVVSNQWVSDLKIPLNHVLSRATSSTPALVAGESVLTGEDAPLENRKVPPQAKEHPWKGEVRVGADVLYGKHDRRIFHGRAKLDYRRPYEDNPALSFKNSFDVTLEYGKTDGEKSSDRLYALDKTAFDLTRRWYLYGLVGGGYDYRLKIDAQYEAGPGAGYRLFTGPDFTMNLEGGLNYQAQYRNGGDLEDVYYRVAEEMVWKIRPRMNLVEKLEVFPRINLSSVRLRFESTLSYELWRNVSVNLTVLDLFDTDPAESAAENELQIRSSLGLKF